LTTTIRGAGTVRTYLSSAELVVEIVSPDDDTWNKLAFYGAHQVDELLIVDPEKRRVDWLGLGPAGGYAAIERSRLIELGSAELAERLDWPPPQS
jgi:Uma2 family endonuclease